MGQTELIVSIIAVLGGVMSAVAELLKKEDRINPKNIPYLLLGIGLVVGLASAPLLGVGLYVGAVGGVLSGLGALGYYQVTKTLK